jgi:hypothetical protein
MIAPPTIRWLCANLEPEPVERLLETDLVVTG